MTSLIRLILESTESDVALRPVPGLPVLRGEWLGKRVFVLVIREPEKLGRVLDAVEEKARHG